jgi:hypothetical protein
LLNARGSVFARSTQPQSQRFIYLHLFVSSSAFETLSLRHCLATDAFSLIITKTGRRARMCTKIIHTFGCGHRTANDFAPCKTSRGQGQLCKSSDMKVKSVSHDEKCHACEENPSQSAHIAGPTSKTAARQQHVGKLQQEQQEQLVARRLDAA